jgi:hypothetical protein
MYFYLVGYSPGIGKREFISHVHPKNPELMERLIKKKSTLYLPSYSGNQD